MFHHLVIALCRSINHTEISFYEKISPRKCVKLNNNSASLIKNVSTSKNKISILFLNTDKVPA